MIYGLTLILFVGGAISGIVMALQRFTGRPVRPAFALVHGLLVGTALFLLVSLAAGTQAGGSYTWGLVALLAAAAGGLTMLLGFHLRKHPLPAWLVLVHGLTAIIGLIFIAAPLIAGSNTP